MQVVISKELEGIVPEEELLREVIYYRESRKPFDGRVIIEKVSLISISWKSLLWKTDNVAVLVIEKKGGTIVRVYLCYIYKYGYRACGNYNDDIRHLQTIRPLFKRSKPSEPNDPIETLPSWIKEALPSL